MRKFKRIVPFIAAVCLVFSLCFSLACKTDENVLQSLTLDTSNAKVDYSLGEEYRSTGLQVTANYSSGQTEAVSIENVTINSSAYDAYTLGSYDIIVSYSNEGTTVEASYKVNVVEMLSGGLVVTLKSGRESMINLSPSRRTADFTSAANWIEVRKPDKNGDVDMNSAALSKDSYTVGVYKNGVPVTNLSAANRGIYQIVASMYDEMEDYTYEGFTLISVFDNASKIELNTNDETVKTTQVKGLRETMTPTWKFTVTFNSGDTEIVDKTSPYLTIPRINPNISGNGGSVTVTYAEPKILEAPATTPKEVEVHYTLTGEQSNPDLAILNFSDTSVFTKSDDPIGTVVYDGSKPAGDAGVAIAFEVVGGDKGKITDKKSALIELPTGIVIDGQDKYPCNQVFNSGGASTASSMLINFTLDRNCEIYVYAKSNGPEDRCMYLETENDYVEINKLEGYLDISGVPTALSNDNDHPYSAHAVTVTGLSSEIPADFQLTFDSSINVFYILIIFPEEA
ncbi:MAG: bacterial Ig-like domain-containing protein [Clostridia bacterium]|nr:bacterial Ig-like domain-containing protein [Clostridia bacterium]